MAEANKYTLLNYLLHSTILKHTSMELVLAFHITNHLSISAMILMQTIYLIKEVLELYPRFRRGVWAKILAVWYKDYTCT